VKGATRGVNAVVWFKIPDADSEKNSIYYLNEEAINKFQFTTSEQNYIKPSHFGTIKFTEHI